MAQVLAAFCEGVRRSSRPVAHPIRTQVTGRRGPLLLRGCSDLVGFFLDSIDARPRPFINRRKTGGPVSSFETCRGCVVPSQNHEE